MAINKICVIGLGYIGLPIAALLANKGIFVVGVDINERIVNQVNAGEIHINEPGLKDIVQKSVEKKLLTCFTKLREADVFIIAVPTPFYENYQPNLDYIKNAVQSLSTVLKSGDTIILESTSPVGTTEKLVNWLSKLMPNLSFPSIENESNQQADIFIAYCPERMIPGKAIKELQENNRIIGGVDKWSTQKAIEVYEIFVKEGSCVATDVRTAEMSKLTENAYRDVNIAFANELSMICDKHNINVWKLIQLANLHPRVNILQPSCGVGGHCIAVDPWFIVSQDPDCAHLIFQARKINDKKPKYVVKKIKEYFKKENITIAACLGITFKPDVDDMRESPALYISQAISQEVDELLVVEPNISSLPHQLKDLKNIRLVTLKEALKYAGAIVVLVKHKEFVNNINHTSVLDFVNAV